MVLRRRLDDVTIEFRPRRGYDNFPGDYGYHRAIYVKPETIGVVIEKKADFYKILFGAREIWIQRELITKA